MRGLKEGQAVPLQLQVLAYNLALFIACMVCHGELAARRPPPAQLTSFYLLVAAGGLRAQHSDTWLALFDLYRATGQQSKFEALAMDYLQRFGWSAPQWYSLPRMVAETAVDFAMTSLMKRRFILWA